MRNNRLIVKLSNWELDNPIIPASGTFGYGYEGMQYYDINMLGTFSMKGTTVNPRFGNKLPRIAEVESGMINSVGLQNPGIDEVIKTEFTKLKKVYNKKIIANIYANTLEDFSTMISKLENEDIVGIIELNISCPNVKKGEKNFWKNPEDLNWLITNLKKKHTKKPIYVKLSPMVSDIQEIALAAVKGGADGLTIANTLNAMKIDLVTRKPLLNNIFGGMSGPAVKPIIMRLVYLVRKVTDLPIIASGGAINAKDVLEFMYAGANAVEIGTANLINPYACKEIIEQLPNEMDKLNISNISEIIGVAHVSTK